MSSIEKPNEDESEEFASSPLKKLRPNEDIEDEDNDSEKEPDNVNGDVNARNCLEENKILSSNDRNVSMKNLFDPLKKPADKKKQTESLKGGACPALKIRKSLKTDKPVDSSGKVQEDIDNPQVKASQEGLIDSNVQGHPESSEN